MFIFKADDGKNFFPPTFTRFDILNNLYNLFVRYRARDRSTCSGADSMTSGGYMLSVIPLSIFIGLCQREKGKKGTAQDTRLG
jgi:hypothetical protein